MNSKLKGFTELNPWNLPQNFIKAMGKDFMELTMGNHDEGANAMTAAWGGVGCMWNLPVAFVVVRGEEYRYSRHLMDKEPLFSACFLDDSQNEAKTLLGRVHGWDDPDKITSAGLHTGWCGIDLVHNNKPEEAVHAHTPFIEESKLVLICETISAHVLDGDGFKDKILWDKHYTKEGPHCLYIAQIRSAFAKES